MKFMIKKTGQYRKLVIKTAYGPYLESENLDDQECRQLALDLESVADELVRGCEFVDGGIQLHNHKQERDKAWTFLHKLMYHIKSEPVIDGRHRYHMRASAWPLITQAKAWMHKQAIDNDHDEVCPAYRGGAICNCGLGGLREDGE